MAAVVLIALVHAEWACSLFVELDSIASLSLATDEGCNTLHVA